jgi:hypothetical protein
MLAPVFRCLSSLALVLTMAGASAAGSAWAQGSPAPVSPAGTPPVSASVDAASAGDASPIALASGWLAEGQAAQAWALLSPLEAVRQGDAEFDYLLAMAALGSGRAAAAVAPLRRVLAVEPRFDGARLELARALAGSGDRQGARQEYEAIVARSPSATSRAAAQRALAVLGGVPARAPTARHVTALVLGAGYDSNANASTSDSVFGFTLDPRAVQQASSFAEIGAAWRSQFAPAPRLGVVTQLRAGHRLNPEARFVDQTVVDASLGLNARLGIWTAGLTASAATGWLDGESFYRSAHLEASAARPLGARWELVGVGRAAELDFAPDRFRPLDVARYVWGAALQRRATAAGVPVFGLALLGGRDDVRQASSPFSNDRYGARLYGAHAFDARRAVFGEMSWLASDFFGARGFLGVDRLDRQMVAAVGVEARDWPARNWRLVPQLRYTDNRSNVTLFRFQRFEASVFVRREFD